MFIYSQIVRAKNANIMLQEDFTRAIDNKEIVPLFGVAEEELDQALQPYSQEIPVPWPRASSPPAQRLPLSKARQAHELLGKGGVTGKIVLVLRRDRPAI